ncbi:MATE family efflux transporter [Treponema brennaborense]|uniref:Multidrug export protein MepA n=1 Tax=Treponema brennaborense (strain DSM 12168 / CIP 105900 / DD5/3) TaxID=906968 RepID=F4LNW3_TREBD|nr:MATE family efflux transporter [Treponema brennaborense]AEE17940.1 multi antimicrobial extrusion protein MatE [Treponema brennaborense DSM 12168]
MTIQLSEHFTYRKLFRFVFSSILMMVFTSLYSIVDGFFVSRFVGKTPFAAINLLMPIIMGVSTVGFMLGTGGSAIVSMTLGQKKKDLADKYFSMIVYAGIILGIICAFVGSAVIRPVARLLGAEGELLEDCVMYGKIIFAFIPLYMLQVMFQSFFVAAEKPSYSLKVSVAAGLTNMVLDYVFIVILKKGLAGAAVATVIGYGIGGITPLVYFARRNNSSPLRLTKTKWYGQIFAKSCTNGSSEMVSNLSTSIVGTLYNMQLMKYAGENGVAAYGVMMYVGFIFAAIFIGYSIGSSPIVSYHYGAENSGELKNMYRKGLSLMVLGGIVMVFAAELFARPLVQIFTGYDSELTQMTMFGFRIFILSYLFAGINIWGSSFFTALNDGLVSAAISFLRTLVFQVATVLILPILFGLNGIWFAIIIADLLAATVTITFLLTKRKKYGY